MSLELAHSLQRLVKRDPLQMKWYFVRKLYIYANHSDLRESEHSSANIYYQYLVFRERDYYLLNERMSVSQIFIDSKVCDL